MNILGQLLSIRLWSRLIGVLVLWLFAPALVSATCSSTNVSAMVPGTATTAVVSMPTAAPAGATLYKGILNRTDETTTISSVVGSVNATGWTATTGSPADLAVGTGRTWLYVKVNASAGTDTITTTFSGSINFQVIAWWCDDAGGAQTLEATATVSSANGTNHDSNTVATTGTGDIVGFVAGNQTAAFTADGAGESVISGDSAGQRCDVLYEAYASNGTYGLEATAGASTDANFHVVGTKNAGGASTAPLFMLIGIGAP